MNAIRLCRLCKQNAEYAMSSKVSPQKQKQISNHLSTTRRVDFSQAAVKTRVKTEIKQDVHAST